jgi:hypothetical protein
MRVKPIAIATLLGLLTMSGAGLAGVTVNFVEPEHYGDEDFRISSRRAGIVKAFDKYFKQLGDRYLKGGQSLMIDVLDIDLAGHYERWGPDFDDVRIMRDITPPRFKLRYAFKQGGKVVMSGEEIVTDLTYLWTSSGRFVRERFAYEKDMLKRWFRERFVKLKPPRTWPRH